MADDDMVQVGTWLMPEAYGTEYDHFTQTKTASEPGFRMALYAKRSDLAQNASTAYLAEAPSC